MNEKASSITKPKNWYAFRWACDLHEYRDSNMCQPEESHDCARKDKKGNETPKYDRLSCKVNVCPILKSKLPMNKRQKDLL